MSDFSESVAALIARSARPLDTHELLASLPVADSMIPFGDVTARLTSAGLHHIKGLGWWSGSQWVDERGELHFSQGDGKTGLVLRLLRDYGWPAHFRQIIRWSENRISPDYFRSARGHHTRPFIRNVGLGFFVPAAECERGAVPMSPAVAAAMQGVIATAGIVSRHDQPVTFAVASLMARHGLLTVKYSGTRRRGKYTRTLRIVLTTDAAREQLQRFAAGTAREVI